MDRREDFAAWRLFCRVIRTGSLSRAAMELNLAPAAASRMLTDLERSVGEALLNRRRRPMTGTLRGDALFDVVAPIVENFERFCTENLSVAGASASAGPADDRYVISISAYQGYGHECLPPLLQEYMKIHPNVSFSLYKEKSIAEVERGEVDVLVTASDVQRPGLWREDTRLLPCIMACSPDYLRRHGTPESPEDLVGHIGLERIGENFPVSRGHLYRNRQSHQARFGQTIYSEDSIGLRDSAVAGIGIVFDLPAEFMITQILRGELVQVLRGWHRQPFQRSVLVQKEKMKTRPEIAAFAHWLVRREREASFEREFKVFSVLGEEPKNYLR